MALVASGLARVEVADILCPPVTVRLEGASVPDGVSPADSP